MDCSRKNQNFTVYSAQYEDIYYIGFMKNVALYSMYYLFQSTFFLQKAQRENIFSTGRAI